MEYSNDEDNFVWTDASNSASSDSDSSIKNKMRDHSGGEESEYDKNYKKELHKQLFSNDEVQHSHEKKVKHRKKRKLDKETSESETNETPCKKKIKIEPESDVDTYKVKHKHKVPNGHSDPYDEQFLDEQVKKEQSFLFPDKVKKKRHKSTSQTNDCDSTMNDTDNNDTITHSKVDKEDRGSMNEEQADNEHSPSKKKKKKKKSQKRDNSETHREETEVNHNIHPEELEYSVEAVDTPDDDVTYQDLTINTTNADPDVSEISKISKGNNTCHDSYNMSTQHAPALHTTRKLSEKIQFEEDSMDLDNTQTSFNTSRTVITQLSDKLKKFTKTNTKLKPYNIQDSDTVRIDEQDEIWIIKCPSDLDVCSFQDKTLNIENKCKIKLNGQTYEGNADLVLEHTSIIISEHGCFKVKNVPINGYLNLNKRIPKVHMNEDSVMVNNQTNFIPLPETKCRHPLLGSHYKKAMKLPPSIAARLKTIDSITVKINKKSNEVIEDKIHTPKSEKSIKQRLYNQEENVTDTTTTTKEEKKKKKKRKHSERDVEAPLSPTPKHKKKRKKYNLEAAETWESEQAIEQSLFDF